VETLIFSIKNIHKERSTDMLAIDKPVVFY